MESELRENRHWTAESDPAELGEAGGGSAGSSLYRILHIDDNPDDRALVARELRGEMRDLTLVEVESEEQLKVELLRGGFDLVITDYELRWTNGLEIVSRLKSQLPEVPVVMFTGTGNEEVAVEAMKAGVQDYVLKTPRHFARLRASVRQTLERVQHSRELSAAEARYKELFDTVPVGLFRCTPQGEIMDANAAFLEMAGLARGEEMARKNFDEIHIGAGEFGLWRDKLERHGSVTCVESRFKTRENGMRWVEIHAKAMRDPETKQIYYEGSVEDITQRKTVEAEREQLIGELTEALGRVRSLTGLLPICSSCKKIRDARGEWNMLESYIENHSQAHFTHSFCPDCAHRLYPEIFLDSPKR